MTDLDELIIHDRTVLKRTSAEIMRRRNIPFRQYTGIITRLIAEGRIEPKRKNGTVADAMPTKIEQPQVTRKPAKKEPAPPSKLDGPNAYRQAADWLEKWGVPVTWQRHKGVDVPEMDGKLTTVAVLVERYFEERRKRATRNSALG